MNTRITVKEIEENSTHELSVVFRVKKGETGLQVRALQVFIMEFAGPRALPKYGADGILGDETLNAMKFISEKYP